MKTFRLNMVCPDIRKEDKRPFYNFDLERCQQRFKARADGCVKCPEGTHWFIKAMMEKK